VFSKMKHSEKTLLTVYVFLLLAGCCIDFFDIAWGTGIWLGEFAATWAIILLFFCSCSLVAFVMAARIIWNDERLHAIRAGLLEFRSRLKWKQLILAVLVFVFPLWLLQFTILGVVFKGPFLRLNLWTLELVFLSFLLTRKDVFIDWVVFLFCILLTAGSFSVLASLKLVTDYPFSLGWSEGNRLWDYSILFGRARYDYPADQHIDVLLDIGRQLVGGLPFLMPGLTITMERAWVALTSILPYLLLGLVTFRSFSREKPVLLAAILWTYLFLKQGPIHPPLVLCAALIAVAWRSRLWLACLLVVAATYFAYVSRYTWTFAPVIWFVMLELLDADPDGDHGFSATSRIRLIARYAAIVAVAVIGALIASLFISPDLLRFFAELEISPSNVWEKITQQSLLWYRLLPNETYGNGILAGLVFAALPLVLILIHTLQLKKWFLNRWQVTFTLLALLVFLVVGLVISTKIGGGGDLHNLDMFLIALFFTAMVAFHKLGKDWLHPVPAQSLRIRALWVILFAFPALSSLQDMRSYDFYEARPWLVALTDAPNERSLEMFPSQSIIDTSLDVIQQEVDLAEVDGDVLFMDQRQLLTFNYIQDVRLVPDYDKKVLMEKALTKDRGYFQSFYTDLAAHRFSLIIVQPLNTPRKGSDFQFGEENNAWVKWVANPLLCFYEIKQTLVEVNVQLLVPRTSIDCEEVLP
jgi:hypothetical protein